MHCAIYIRKSREDRKKKGNKKEGDENAVSHRLALQREQLPAFAQSQGWTYEIYDDGYASAARGKFEELEERARLEGDIRNGTANKPDVILCIELSRLSRDETLQDYTAWLALCSEFRVKLATPSRILDPSHSSDWMLLLMEGGFSAVEMQTLNIRLKDGYLRAYKSGQFLTGQVPPPYKYDHALEKPVIDDTKLEKWKKICKEAETHSAKAVSEKLGIPYITVKRIIGDERLLFYQALRKDPDTGKPTIKCEWEPCMTAEQAALIRKKRKDGFRGYNRREYAGLLSNLGIFSCGYCGRSIRAWKNGRPRKDGSRLDYYGCKANETRRVCEGSRMVPQSIIDEKIICNLIGTLERLEELKAAWFACQSNNERIASQLAALEKEEKLCNERKKRLIDAITNDVLSFEEAKGKKAEIDAALAKINGQREDLLASQSVEPDWELLSLTEEEFESFDTDDKREIISAAIKEIKFYSTYLIINYRFPRSADGKSSTRVHLPPASRGTDRKRLPHYK